MADWIEVGLLGAILLVQVLRWAHDRGLWQEVKQRRRAGQKRRAAHGKR